MWEAFAANLEAGELGAACSITVDGRVVVDIRGGWADPVHPTDEARPSIRAECRKLRPLGTGGAVGFADPAASVGFGYVMNSARPRWQSPRNRALIDALHACLGRGCPPIPPTIRR